MEKTFITYLDIDNSTIAVEDTTIGYDAVRHYYPEDNIIYSYDSESIYMDNDLPKIYSYDDNGNVIGYEYEDHHAVVFNDYTLVSGSISLVPGVVLDNQDKWYFVTEQMKNDIDLSLQKLKEYMDNYQYLNINIEQLYEYIRNYFIYVNTHDISVVSYDPLGIIFDTNPLWSPYKNDIINYIKENFAYKSSEKNIAH